MFKKTRKKVILIFDLSDDIFQVRLIVYYFRKLTSIAIFLQDRYPSQQFARVIDIFEEKFSCLDRFAVAVKTGHRERDPRFVQTKRVL